MLPIKFTMVEFVEFLERLANRDADDAFVILEDTETKKFVQFGRGPGIKLDLPLAALHESEAERAYAFFRELNVCAPRELDAPDPTNSNALRHHATFEYDFGNDARAAAHTALALFAAVYGECLQSRLSLIEN
jgi:hypothetical protein